MVRVVRVSPKAIEGARKALALHEQEVKDNDQCDEEFHQRMIAHYRLLLKRWKVIGE